MRSHQFWSPSESRARNSPVESTWPCTMWPLKRPLGERGRSRFIREPARRSPRLVRSRVSGARSAEKEAVSRSTAVRHTPLTAMLAPSVISWRTVEQRTFSRAPALRVWTDSSVPSSSMIPVNMDVSCHGEFIRRSGMNGYPVNVNGVGAPAPADPAGQRQSFQTAQNLGAVIEKDAIHGARFEGTPVDLAAGLDHQRKVSPPAEPFHRAAEIDAPSGAVEDQHFDAAVLQQLAAAGGGSGRGQHQQIAGGAAHHFGIERQAQLGIHHEAQPPAG